MTTARVTVLLVVLAALGGWSVLAAGQSTAPGASPTAKSNDSAARADSHPARSSDSAIKSDTHTASPAPSGDHARPAASDRGAETGPGVVVKSEDGRSARAAALAKGRAWTRKRRWRSPRSARRAVVPNTAAPLLPTPPPGAGDTAVSPTGKSAAVAIQPGASQAARQPAVLRRTVNRYQAQRLVIRRTAAPGRGIAVPAAVNAQARSRSASVVPVDPSMRAAGALSLTRPVGAGGVAGRTAGAVSSPAGALQALPHAGVTAAAAAPASDQGRAAGAVDRAGLAADSAVPTGSDTAPVRTAGGTGKAGPAGPNSVLAVGVPTAGSKTLQSGSHKPTVRKKAAGDSHDPLLDQAKPDIVGTTDTVHDHTIDSPLQAVGDGWKMVAYLLPTLIFVLVCLNLLRRYQQKNGKLPAMLSAPRGVSRPAGPSLVKTFAGLFTSSAGGQRGGGSANLRVLETITVGSATLHLVDVRGRTLLLAGGGPAGVTLLTEISEQDGAESNDFRQILQAAAADMDGLDLPNSDMPVSAVVGSLEDAMRDTGDSIERRLRRLRDARDAENRG